MTYAKHIGAPSLGRTLTRFSLAGVVALTTLSCSIFDTDVTNPNAVSEEALGEASSAPPLVNGLAASVTRALTGIYGPYSVASDELTWVGSREHWSWLDAGDVSYPINEYIDTAYPFVSEARWLSNYTIEKLEGFDKATTLRDRSGLVRAYIYGAIIYITIGDMFDDFVLASDRTAPAAPLGPENMGVVYDSAVAFLDRALPIAQALNNNLLRSQVLALRARAKYSKAMWALLRPARATPANPFLNNAGANADATAALALMTGNYVFQLKPATNGAASISMASEMNSRQEIRAGDVYINPDPARPTQVAAGAAGIKLRDPVTNQPDPVLLKAIDECCRVASTTLTPFTIISAKEMHLILAEAALATNNTTEFATRINAMRALDALPAWGGTTPNARDMLIYSRQVNLFLQGRRLHDMYRFGIKDAKWLPGNIASKKACFFPIPAIERRTNAEVHEVAEARPSYCS
jgi:starch-binding outer membrane protein, SusD/RagB family